jgi:hypothetical protein
MDIFQTNMENTDLKKIKLFTLKKYRIYMYVYINPKADVCEQKKYRFGCTHTLHISVNSFNPRRFRIFGSVVCYICDNTLTWLWNKFEEILANMNNFSPNIFPSAPFEKMCEEDGVCSSLGLNELIFVWKTCGKYSAGVAYQQTHDGSVCSLVCGGMYPSGQKSI